MEKSFATDDHAELLEAAGGRASSFFERSSGQLTKSASDVITRQDIQNHMPPDDQFGIHLITMGAEETFGPNRNGDSASQKSLDTHHSTFEKFGCVYREHKNKNPKTQGIGSVRLARVNPRMHRGELVVWVEKDKAPDMYKAAKEGKELSFSMSMRLPHDECSCCRKKSKNTNNYCDHLKNSMLQFVPGFEKYAYARNEEGVKFFDISEVKRRADRIATYLGYSFNDEMAKAASAATIITGAQWAAHQLGENLIVPFDPWEELTLEKLAEAETFVHHADVGTRAVLAKLSPQNLHTEQIEILANPDFRNVSGELSKRGMLINFPTFASLVTGRSIQDLHGDTGFSGALNAKLPTLLSAMLGRGGCRCSEDVADSVTPDDVGCSFTADKDPIDKLLREVGNDLGMTADNTADRALRITITKHANAREMVKIPVVDAYYDGLAEAYGHYIVKAAHHVKDLQGVSEKTLFRAVAASLVIPAL